MFYIIYSADPEYKKLHCVLFQDTSRAALAEMENVHFPISPQPFRSSTFSGQIWSNFLFCPWVFPHRNEEIVTGVDLIFHSSQSHTPFRCTSNLSHGWCIRHKFHGKEEGIVNIKHTGRGERQFEPPHCLFAPSNCWHCGHTGTPPPTYIKRSEQWQTLADLCGIKKDKQQSCHLSHCAPHCVLLSNYCSH